MTTRTRVRHRVPEAVRFWTRVSFDEDGCWRWPATDDAGYGRFQWAGGAYAHRYAYTFCVGPIPEGLDLDHLCFTRNCVNPDHLEPVTHRVNMLRGNSIPAKHARKTHCPRGHAYDEINTYLYRGKRYCRPCMNVHSQRRNERLAAERLAKYEAGLREFLALRKGGMAQ